MIITLVLIVAAAVSYFLGSVNGAIIASRYVFRRDVRDLGSGNAGLTNFYRSFGTRGMALVVGIDVVKGVLAALLSGWLLGLTAGDYAGSLDFTAIGRLFGTFCCVLGHCLPVFHGFRGGKGILCGAAAAFVVDWRAGLICFVVFGIAFVLTRFVSLGSILGAISFPITIAVRGYGSLAFTLAAFSVALILIGHRSNIARLISRSESKFEFKKNVTRKLDGDEF